MGSLDYKGSQIRLNSRQFGQMAGFSAGVTW